MFIKKPDSPRERMRFTRPAWRRIQEKRRWRMARRPVRKRSTQTADTPWEMTVARAAPFTPMPSRKMKMGSSTRLSTAPMTTVIIPVRPKPCVLMKGFIPRLIITNRVPSR